MYYADTNNLIRRYRPEVMGSIAIPYSAAQGTAQAVHRRRQMYTDIQPDYSSTGYYNSIVISEDRIYFSTILYGTVYNL
ncbi:hypothetical protein [Bacillus thuringiensis]|uniref:DUF3947 family protein n=1 Tax=Bacillus thuringiensis serovar andalousiensis TaxID=257985 RepID=A0A6H0TDT8_BACTU|nr:hypothetical protein [Bacillus thuringiensis]QIW19341.1 hypothetical protein EVG22_13090 [Bacillus thuringiensis serovar andalousiensis]